MSKTVRLALVVTVGIALNASTVFAASWTAPFGIPTPPFGIDEVAPATPNPWTVSTAGFYYVDATKSAATDGNNTYGTPLRPRRTIPSTLPAGSVVELHGTYDTLHTSPETIVAEGTSRRPVWIRGVSAASRPLVRRFWEFKGSYAVLENLEFGPMADQSDTGALVILLPSDHIVLRHSDMHGTQYGGGLGLLNWEVAYGEIYLGPGTVNNVVIYDNKIHDNGDLRATYDQDVHGITVGDHVNHLWVVDNQLYRNSGDGIQINSGRALNAASTHHIYVGRNVSHGNKQAGFWAKQATDLIFSQNESYNHRPSNSSSGQCIGGQYGPDWVWWLFNKIHDCEFGIAVMSDNSSGGHPAGPPHMFAIGNVIYNIHKTTTDYDADDPWGPAGIMMAGGFERHVVNNTIWDVDSGVSIATWYGSLDLANNIIGNVTRPGASHLTLNLPLLALTTTIRNDLFFGTPRINRGNGPTFPTARRMAIWESISDDPQFVNAAGNDFHLEPSSPALGAGEVNAAYAVFEQRYGMNIRVDFDGTPRPAAYAMGAYERPCVPSAPEPPQNLSGSHTSTDISLQWFAPPSGCSAPPSTYILEIGSTTGATDLANSPVGAVTALTIPATDVPAGSYYFRVRAQNALGTSAPSNEIVILYSPPGRPTALILSKTLLTLTLRWTAPTIGGSPTGYLLEIGSAPGLTDRGSFPLPVSPTALTDRLPARGTYFMRIRAQNAYGTSPPTNEVRLVVP
jgi:hypothetical protein